MSAQLSIEDIALGSGKPRLQPRSCTCVEEHQQVSIHRFHIVMFQDKKCDTVYLTSRGTEAALAGNAFQ